MRHFFALILLALLSGPVVACPEPWSEKDDPKVLFRCAERLKSEKTAVYRALDFLKQAAADPTSLFELMDFGILRGHADNVSVAAISVWRTIALALDPEYTRNERLKFDPFAPFRSRFARPEALEQFFRTTKSIIVRLIDRSAVRGMIMATGDRLKPVLEKPADALLAQKGMLWLFAYCYIEGNEAADGCKDNSFPADFKTYYGVDADSENVWALGFLIRRDLETRGLSKTYQKIALELLKELGE